VKELKMEQIKAYISDYGYICLSQENCGEESVVCFPPEQTDVIIDWIKTLKEKLQEN
jgi:ectoine hydroxylase-related dioxygenase (phytanoyl-CoA dioxygenase family)